MPTTLVPGKIHPALDLHPDDQVEYLSVVATLVTANRSIAPEEIELLKGLCEQLRLDQERTAQVIERVYRGDPSISPEEMRRMSSPDLRYAVVVDAVDIMYADGVVDDEEVEHIEALAKGVGVSKAQLGMIRRYVETRRGKQPG